MALNIPDSVFDKYYEVIDSTFDIFGVPCQLVTIDKEEVTVPDNNIPNINSPVNKIKDKKSINFLSEKLLFIALYLDILGNKELLIGWVI